MTAIPDEEKTRVVSEYHLFKGYLQRNIPQLFSGRNDAGEQINVPRSIVTPAQVAALRLQGRRRFEYDFCNGTTTTSLCALRCPTSREVTFTLDDTLIREINAATRLRTDLPLLSREQYDAVQDGFVLSGTQVCQLLENQYALPEVREALWEFAMDGKEDVKKEYERYVQSEHDLCFRIQEDLYKRAFGVSPPHQRGISLMMIGPLPTSDMLPIFGINHSLSEDIIGVAELRMYQFLARDKHPDLTIKVKEGCSETIPKLPKTGSDCNIPKWRRGIYS